MNLKQAIEFASSYLKKKDLKFDMIAGESFSSGLEVFNKKISNIENENTRGLGVRVFQNQKPGYSYTEKLDKQSIETMLENAISLCEINSTIYLDLPKNTVLPNLNLNTFNQQIEDNLDWTKMEKTALEMEDFAYKESNFTENVPYAYMGKSKSETFLANSNDLLFHKTENLVSLGIGVVAKKNTIAKMGSYSRTGRNLEIINPFEISKEATRRGIALLDAKPISSGKYPVVLSNLVSPALFGSFSNIFYAESVQKSQSRLKGYLNKDIASSILNLNCEPHNTDFSGTRLFDGEGVLTKSTKVIQKGVLKSFLYNLETAKKDQVESTGHAKRSYSGKVGTGFSNFVVEKGEKKIEHLLAIYSKCFYITKLGFNSSSCDPFSGTISIEAQGFLYENGEKVQAVDSVVLNINFFDLLKKIVGISDNYSDSFSSYKIPDILIEEANIAGS